MISAGIDLGTRFVKAVVLDSERGLLGSAVRLAGIDPHEVLIETLENAIDEAGLEKGGVAVTAATGSAGEETRADLRFTDAAAAAAGAHHLSKSVRMVLDIGAESGMAIRIGESGKMLDVSYNEKCAAGVGSFVDSMARVLNASVEEMDEWGLESESAAKLNAQCVVFAESEVVSLLHRQTPRGEISRAIYNSIASRAVTLMRRSGMVSPVLVAGGLGLSRTFLDVLRREVPDVEFIATEHPELVSATGAAVLALKHQAKL